MNSTRLLTLDARNRAWRTFLTGLAIDVAVGIALVLTTVFATANGWGDLEWAILSFSVAKSVVQSVCSFILRRFLDGKVPTPLPPTPQPAPADPDPGPDAPEDEAVALPPPPGSRARRVEKVKKRRGE